MPVSARNAHVGRRLAAQVGRSRCGSSCQASAAAIGQARGCPAPASPASCQAPMHITSAPATQRRSGVPGTPPTHAVECRAQSGSVARLSRKGISITTPMLARSSSRRSAASPAAPGAAPALLEAAPELNWASGSGIALCPRAGCQEAGRAGRMRWAALLQHPVAFSHEPSRRGRSTRRRRRPPVRRRRSSGSSRMGVQHQAWPPVVSTSIRLVMVRSRGGARARRARSSGSRPRCAR